jgi:hypothetical protein
LNAAAGSIQAGHCGDSQKDCLTSSRQTKLTEAIDLTNTNTESPAREEMIKNTDEAKAEKLTAGAFKISCTAYESARFDTTGFKSLFSTFLPRICESAFSPLQGKRRRRAPEGTLG